MAGHSVVQGNASSTVTIYIQHRRHKQMSWPWPEISQELSISSGQRNLMKTLSQCNGANTGGITKIALKRILDFFRQSRQTHKIAKFWLSNSFYNVKNCPNLSKKFFIEDYQFKTPSFVKTFFDKFNFKNNSFLKLVYKIVYFLNLSTLSKNFQKYFRCNFCDSTSALHCSVTKSRLQAYLS